jgi:hypothetical protein
LTDGLAAAVEASDVPLAELVRRGLANQGGAAGDARRDPGEGDDGA